MSILSRIRIPAATAALVLTLAACGGSADDGAVEDAVAEVSAAGDALASAAAEGSEEDMQEAQQDLEESVEDMAESLEAQQSGGSASLTVGDETWDFDGVLCAFGEDEIGQEGAEFVLSAIADGLQFYLTIDSFGHSASINDIENFENPSVSWESETDGFITLSGNDASGESSFINYDTMETADGSFEATCP